MSPFISENTPILIVFISPVVFCKPFLHFFRLFLRFVNYRQFSAGNRRVF